jgi:hypothetical protein
MIQSDYDELRALARSWQAYANPHDASEPDYDTGRFSAMDTCAQDLLDLLDELRPTAPPAIPMNQNP